MPIDREARAYTHQLMHVPLGESVVDPSLSGISLKPHYYAALAHLTELMLDSVLPDENQIDFDQLVVESPFRKPTGSGFDKLRADLLFTFQTATTNAYFDESYLPASDAALKLQRRRHFADIDVNTQLRAGSETAINTMVGLLSHVPAIMEYHAPDTSTDDYAAVARASHKPMWDLAQLCINQLVFAHQALSHEPIGWASPNHRLRPEAFKLVSQVGQVPRIIFADLENLHMPDDPSLSLGEVACHEALTIGCPVTFMPRKFMRLWHWMIDIVEQRELWNAEALDEGLAG